MGWTIQAEMKDSEVRKDFIQMTIGIMSQSVETEQQKVLRGWASRVLEQSSPVSFAPKEFQALRRILSEWKSLFQFRAGCHW